nr:beta-galactosidase [Anaerolineae bacterium]
MGEPPVGSGQASPRVRRFLLLAWLSTVLLVIACVLLGTIWSLRVVEARRSAATLPMSPAPPATPAASLSVPTPIFLSTPTIAQTGEAQPTPTILPAADSSFGYGIAVQLRVSSQLTVTQVQQLGMNWVRQDISWAEVEPEPGQFNWDILDPVFITASSNSLKVLVTISDAPDWSRLAAVEGLDGPPDNPQDLAAFVSQLVLRYQGAIHAVEVWQEMNINSHWSTIEGLNPQSYIDLLIPVAEAIQQADPGVIVISGGLSPTGTDDGVNGIDDYRYMQAMISAGLLEIVHCVGARHAGYNVPPDAPYDAIPGDPTAYFTEPFNNPHHSWSFYSTLRGYHDIIAAVGRDIPLCVTEFGWPTTGVLSREAVPDYVFDNSLIEQTDYVIQAFRLMHEWDFVWMAFLSNLDYSPEVFGAEEDDLTVYYRIVRRDGTPRPVFDAIQAMPKPP